MDPSRALVRVGVLRRSHQLSGKRLRISHRHRFIFFANPKTGSRSVREVLDPFSEVHGRPADDVTPDFPFYNHMRPCDLRPVFAQKGWDFDAYFKFVMVRNPWARMVSLFEMEFRGASNDSAWQGLERFGTSMKEPVHSRVRDFLLGYTPRVAAGGIRSLGG